MNALVYQGPLDDRPMPEITALTDAIVEITEATICGTGFHLLKGDVPGPATRAAYVVTRVSAWCDALTALTGGRAWWRR